MRRIDSFLILFVLFSAAMYSAVPTTAEIYGHSVYITSSSGELHYNTLIKLNDTVNEFQLEESYENVIANISIHFGNAGDSTSPIKLRSETFISPDNIVAQGNVSQTAYSNESGFDEYILGSNANMSLSYSGSFGCSDCVVFHRWVISLNGTDKAEVMLNYHVFNVEQYEKVPVNILAFALPLLLIPIIRKKSKVSQ